MLKLILVGLALALTWAPLVSVPSAAASHLPNKTIVLIGALGYPLGETPWVVLRQQLGMRGFPQSNVLEYSYAGGSFGPDGAWNPNPGGICESFSKASFPQLRQMIADLATARPDHEVFLVGYGGGGFVAMQALRLALSGQDDPAVWRNLSGIASISGPIHGLSRQRGLVEMTFAAQRGCTDSSMVVWMEEVGSEPDRFAVAEVQAEKVMALGYKIATLGNTVDCFYQFISPDICPKLNALLRERGVFLQFLGDERPTQYIKNGNLFREYNIVMPIDAEPVDNHTAVLISTQPMAELSEFLLSQTR